MFRVAGHALDGVTGHAPDAARWTPDPVTTEKAELQRRLSETEAALSDSRERADEADELTLNETTEGPTKTKNELESTKATRTCSRPKRQRSPSPKAKFVPLIVTRVPPESGPVIGDMPLTRGGP